MNTKTKTKFLTVPLMALTMLAGGLGLQVNQASAELTATGPVDPITGFPMWYQDSSGLKLGIQKVTDGALGLAAPIEVGNAHSEQVGFGEESFYWEADATVTLPGGGTAELILATEATYTAVGQAPGEEQLFNRVRVVINDAVPNSTYTIVHPYGAGHVVTTDVNGNSDTSNTIDLGCVADGGVLVVCGSENPATPGKTFFSLIEEVATGGPIGNPWLRLATETITSANGKKYITGSGVIANGPNGNLFVVDGPDTDDANTGTFNIFGVLFAPFVEVTPVGTSDTTPTITGTIAGADVTTTVNVTVGTDPANADIVAVVNPTAGTWSATVPAALAIGAYDVTVTTDLGDPAESDTVEADAVQVRPASVETFRFWSDTKQHHFFTTSATEKDFVIATYPTEVWNFEGVSWSAMDVAGAANALPVYRFWSDTKQGHFYTISESEKDSVVATYPDEVWKLEGTAYYAFPTAQPNTTPVYRFWSDTKQGHFYTTSEAEKDEVIAIYPDDVWKFEGIAFYVPTN